MRSGQLKAVVTQHTHILTLVNRLQTLEENLAKVFLEKPNWQKFINDHIDESVNYYLTKCVGINWEDTTMYSYKVYFNFYKGKEYPDYIGSSAPVVINSFDMRVEIRRNLSSTMYMFKDNGNEEPLIYVLNTKPISIDTLDDFLNAENIE